MTALPQLNTSVAPNAAPDIPISLREVLIEQRRGLIAQAKMCQEVEAALPAALKPALAPYFARMRTTTIQQVRAIERGLGLKKSLSKKPRDRTNALHDK